MKQVHGVMKLLELRMEELREYISSWPKRNWVWKSGDWWDQGFLGL